MEYRTAERALNDGVTLHGFRSAAGLRVVSLQRGDRELGYGEHPYFDTALQHAEEDYLAGKRPYAEVYGKIHTHYLSGSDQPNSEVDRWLLCGGTVDARYEEGLFVVHLRRLDVTRTPHDVHQRALAGEVIVWEKYGFKLLTQSGGGQMSKTIILERPGGTKRDPWFWPVVQTGCGLTLGAARHSALTAPAEEDLEYV